MATLTNLTKHSATLTNKAKHSATVTNAPKHGRFGDKTMAELANTLVSEWEDTTFDDMVVIFTNQTKH